MSTNKFLNNWKELVASSSFNCVAQVEAYALKIQQCVLRSIKIFVSWANFSFEIKFFWNEKCAEAMTTMRRRRRKWITLHIEKIWRNYLKTSDEKKRIIAKKKKSSSNKSFASSATRRQVSRGVTTHNTEDCESRVLMIEQSQRQWSFVKNFIRKMSCDQFYDTARA
jgi:hypothetical protein